MMYILIGADIVPTKSNIELFIKGDAQSLVGGGLRDLLNKADFRIFNLETPLTNQEKPILKQGPNLIAPAETVTGYKALGADLLTLANNHILDQDVEGLKTTIETLEMADISHLGAGEDVLSASKPFVFSLNDKRIGVYACVEHEFSVAKENKPGANPFDPLWAFDHVKELKENVDYVIVLYHGGKENYRYPSPMLQKICRRFADKGADLVLCQHSHCIGCEEKYNGSTIVYGQGNFIFDRSDDDSWQTSLLVKLDESMNISYIPLVKTGNGVSLADDSKKKSIIQGFRARSEEIKDEDFLQNAYDDVSDAFFPQYMGRIKGKERFFYKILNKLSGNKLREKTIQSRYDSAQLTALWNWIVCEAHQELLLRGIWREIERKKQRRT